jgi:hypothetical protein
VTWSDVTCCSVKWHILFGATYELLLRAVYIVCCVTRAIYWRLGGSDDVMKVRKWCDVLCRIVTSVEQGRILSVDVCVSCSIHDATDNWVLNTCTKCTIHQTLKVAITALWTERSAVWFPSDLRYFCSPKRPDRLWAMLDGPWVSLSGDSAAEGGGWLLICILCRD